MSETIKLNCFLHLPFGKQIHQPCHLDYQLNPCIQELQYFTAYSTLEFFLSRKRTGWISDRIHQIHWWIRKWEPRIPGINGTRDLLVRQPNTVMFYLCVGGIKPTIFTGDFEVNDPFSVNTLQALTDE